MPAREVSYSGHTTLAAAHALLEAGVGGSQLVLATGTGPVVIEVEREGGRSLIWQSPPTVLRAGRPGSVAAPRGAWARPATKWPAGRGRASRVRPSRARPLAGLPARPRAGPRRSGSQTPTSTSCGVLTQPFDSIHRSKNPPALIAPNWQMNVAGVPVEAKPKRRSSFRSSQSLRLRALRGPSLVSRLS